ncbi:uncharacterized protein PITG_13858 [Phytophthora infestans T30-4]|uniref:Uncharacterized protein n=1 Tax=Phytophthora infestans (strain T30-4) TaxID=403677 RepID=D0NMZ0_PHYIT|nr:uncharacterized protein PITG_13858 [Phytophthora infestans T30-4]EEY61897.1 hypothetical protein PITG_13858 [Phytophthora infestans T30-4]|eukprot:XP_002899537.1 hypothetical protein PITG_13858 [Phytophthora infestans T30-4]
MGYGPRTYDLQKTKARIPYSKDRYVLGAFSWARVMDSEAPALVFVGSCDSMAGANFEHEKKLFYKKLKLPAKSEKARVGANAKKEKKRKLNEKLAAVRAAKHQK